MKLKKRTALLSVLLVAVLNINAFASVLGELTGGNRITMTDDAEFYHYTYGTDTTVQSEYYVEYKPNSDVIPIMVNGEEIYGKRTITQAAQYMKDNGMKPLIGINADYFSYQTGIPMGHTVIDGELVTSDTTGQNAIGFNDDGTGFISWLEIQSRFITYTGEEMMLDCINKWCQPTISTSYLLTDKFGKSTKTSGNCKFIIFSVVDGKLAIGKSIFLKVEEKFDYDGDIAIPDGKLVLVMTNTYGDQSKLEFMDSLQVGQELELKTESVYDKEKWASAKHGMGSVGGRLIENGKVYTNFEAGTAPRTAVGIKPDGNIVFYVIDGRQPGVSTGVQIKTLAKRMSELGCADAINLDGGGSTAIAGVFPGSDEFTVVNSPSEGTLRKCANYIFLKDLRKNAAPSYKFDVNVSSNRRFLAGYTEELDIRSVTDGEGNSIDVATVSKFVDNPDGSAITITGNTVKADGNGVGYVTLSAGSSKHHIPYTVHKTPTKISAFTNGGEISELKLIKGSDEVFDIDARAFVHGKELNSDDSCYSWSCDKNIGYIDKNGMFVPDTGEIKNGYIYIKAGTKTQKIPVSVESPSIFADMDFHWGKEYANELYHMGIVTGENKDGVTVFRPESHITRGEFAVMAARYMGLDLANYEKYKFLDYDEIPDWQKPYANAVAAEGIISGKQADFGVTFSGNDKITRAEAMTILFRTSKKNFHFADVNFKDSYKIPDYAEKAVNTLVGLGIVNGYEDETLKPLGNVTRAESAKIIQGCIGVL